MANGFNGVAALVAGATGGGPTEGARSPVAASCTEGVSARFSAPILVGVAIVLVIDDIAPIVGAFDAIGVPALLCRACCCVAIQDFSNRDSRCV